MKLNEIAGYYPISKESRDAIWNSGVFIFDASFVLNLYRYNEEVVRELLSVLQRLKGRAYITHYGALEYLRNREKVRREQMASYDKVKECVQGMLSKFQSDTRNFKKRHSYIDTGDFEVSIKKISEEFSQKLDEARSKDKMGEAEDHLLKELTEIFEGTVFKGFNFDQDFPNFEKDARFRFENRVPPGYEDDTKKSESTYIDGVLVQHKYGDLIVWREIIALARQEEADVVFVTDDDKEDWWLKEQGQKISPRPELIREFHNGSGKNILIYSSDAFSNAAKKYLGAEISSETSDYIKEVKNQYVNWLRPLGNSLRDSESFRRNQLRHDALSFLTLRYSFIDTMRQDSISGPDAGIDAVVEMKGKSGSVACLVATSDAFTMRMSALRLLSLIRSSEYSGGLLITISPSAEEANRVRSAMIDSNLEGGLIDFIFLIYNENKFSLFDSIPKID